MNLRRQENVTLTQRLVVGQTQLSFSNVDGTNCFGQFDHNLV